MITNVNQLKTQVGNRIRLTEDFSAETPAQSEGTIISIEEDNSYDSFMLVRFHYIPDNKYVTPQRPVDDIILADPGGYNIIWSPELVETWKRLGKCTQCGSKLDFFQGALLCRQKPLIHGVHGGI